MKLYTRRCPSLSYNFPWGVIKIVANLEVCHRFQDLMMFKTLCSFQFPLLMEWWGVTSINLVEQAHMALDQNRKSITFNLKNKPGVCQKWGKSNISFMVDYTNFGWPSYKTWNFTKACGRNKKRVAVPFSFLVFCAPSADWSAFNSKPKAHAISHNNNFHGLISVATDLRRMGMGFLLVEQNLNEMKTWKVILALSCFFMQ